MFKESKNLFWLFKVKLTNNILNQSSEKRCLEWKADLINIGIAMLLQ